MTRSVSPLDHRLTSFYCDTAQIGKNCQRLKSEQQFAHMRASGYRVQIPGFSIQCSAQLQTKQLLIFSSRCFRKASFPSDRASLTKHPHPSAAELPEVPPQSSPLTHEARRIGDVCADFAIYLDEPLHAYLLDLVSCQGILQPVPQKDDERKAFPQLVRTCRWTGCLQTEVLCWVLEHNSSIDCPQGKNATTPTALAAAPEDSCVEPNC